MATIGEKKLEVPIKDFDTEDYDEVVVIDKSEKTSIDLINADAKELLVYFCDRFKLAHGYEYKLSWVKELSIFKSFKERYELDAGPMIEILFDKYGGIMNGGVMTVTAFSKGSKWIQDRLYIELQSCKSKAAEPKINVEGLMSSNDFLNRFSMGK